jgi:hypothetical protein
LDLTHDWVKKLENTNFGNRIFSDDYHLLGDDTVWLL